MTAKAKLATPVASDPTERVADWLELQALRSPDQNVSLETLVQIIRRNGSVDAITTMADDSCPNLHDTGSVLSQSVAEDSFIEIENRKSACGDSRYPFVIEQGLLKIRQDTDNGKRLGKAP